MGRPRHPIAVSVSKKAVKRSTVFLYLKLIWTRRASVADSVIRPLRRRYMKESILEVRWQWFIYLKATLTVTTQMDVFTLTRVLSTRVLSVGTWSLVTPRRRLALEP